MGLDSIVAQTLIRVKADTSSAKAELRSLRGVEAQAAKERIAEMEATNRGLDAQIARWGKVTLAVGAGIAVYKTAQAAAKAYLEDLRLESASAGANIDALRKATNGLVETDNLMAFAGKAMHGVWKLNNEEMARVLKGATALQKTMGVELAPTIDALTEAMAKGSTRALKEFGIEAKDKQGVLRELDKVVASLGGNTKMAGDDMRAAGVKIADTFDDLQGALGKFVMTLEPAAAVLADFVGWLAKAGNLTDAIAGVDTQGGTREQKLRREAARQRERAAALREANKNKTPMTMITGGLNYQGESVEGLEVAAAELERQADAIAQRVAAKAAGAALMSAGQALYGSSIGQLQRGIWHPTVDVLKGRGGAGGGPAGLDPSLLPSFDDARGFVSTLGGGLGMLGRAGASVYGDAQADAKQRALMAQVAEFQGAQIAANAKGAQRTKILETIIGTPAEIDAMTESLKLASDVFGGLTEAVNAGFDAWITGQGSVVAAFNKAIAEMLRSLAKQMAVEAMKHTAFGIGALAFGGPLMGATASEHFAAAGAFAGVAAAAGVAAKGIGASTGQWSQGGASSGGSRASSPSRTIGNGPSSSDGNAPIIVYVGAEWAAMSKIEQANGIRNAIRLGKRGSRHVRRN